MCTTFFPTPQPDETVHSLITRYHLLSGNLTQSDTLQQLFGNSKGKSDLEQPAAMMLRNIPAGVFQSPQELMMKHTPWMYLYAFKFHFSEANTNGHLGFDNFTRGKLRIGRRVGEFALQKFCPDCLEEDVARLGIGYWRRAHQLPRVNVCALHKAFLISKCSHCGHSIGSDRTNWDVPHLNCPRCSTSMVGRKAQQSPGFHAIQFAQFSNDLLHADFLLNLNKKLMHSLYTITLKPIFDAQPERLSLLAERLNQLYRSLLQRTDGCHWLKMLRFDNNKKASALSVNQVILLSFLFESVQQLGDVLLKLSEDEGHFSREDLVEYLSPWARSVI